MKRMGGKVDRSSQEGQEMGQEDQEMRAKETKRWAK